MIKKARYEDLEKIAELYEKMLDYEDTHIKYTSWQRGIYPTIDTARLGLKTDSLYVFEENECILASVILNTRQPPEYRSAAWRFEAGRDEALVIHTLCVDPICAGSGIGSAIISFAKELASKKGCVAIRLNTTDRNTPAISLYEKNGFSVADTQKILLNGQISCQKHLFMELKI